MERTITYQISESEHGLRVEQYLRHKGYSYQNLTQLKKMPESILINGIWSYMRSTLSCGDTLTVHIQESEYSEHIPPVQLPLDIIYEDDDLLVVNKPAGMPIHPSLNNYKNSLANALMYYYKEQGKPFIFRCTNRLDRDTSGLMIYAQDKQTELALEDAWHHNVYDRRYVALVSGEMEEDEGTVANWLKDNKAYITYSSDTDNGGKYAVTHFHTLERTTAHSLVEFKLETGRKNQIRVHTADMGHPVCGDIKYGNGDDPCQRLCLHAYVLCFYHPVTHQPMEFETPIPAEFRRALKNDR